MALASLLGDFAGGFVDQSNQHRKENLDRQQHQDDKEQEVLMSLANSPDVRPETRAAAVTGLLTRQPGKSSGFDKWFGQHEQHPAFGQILGMLNGGVGEGASPTAGSIRGAGWAPPAGQAQAQGPTAQGGVGVGEQRASTGLPESPSTPASTPGGPASPPPGAFYDLGERDYSRAQQAARAPLDAKMSFAKANNITLTPEDQREMVTGRAQPRTTPQKGGTLTFRRPDGTTYTLAGTQDANGQYFVNDPQQGVVPANWVTGDEVAGFQGMGTGRASAPPNPSTGGKWAFVEDGPGSDKGKWTHYDAQGQPMGQSVPGTRTAPPAFTSVIAGPEGLMGVTRGGSARPVPGSAGFGRAVDPAQTSQAYRGVQERLLAEADKAVPKISPTTMRSGNRLRQYNEYLDNAVRQLQIPGVSNYADFVQQIGGTLQGVQQATPTGPPPDVTAPRQKAKAPPARPAGGGTSSGVQRALDALDAAERGR